MLNDPELLCHLQNLRRDIAQISRRTLIIVRFLNSTFAALLAAGTYVVLDDWGAYEFWMRSSAITVFVIAYLILDRLFCRAEPDWKPLALAWRSLAFIRADEQSARPVIASRPQQARVGTVSRARSATP
jgi:hypothetical protein